jgi:hypothetical protein
MGSVVPEEGAVLDHLAVATKLLIDFTHVVVAIAGDCDHVLVPDSALSLPVLDTELGEAPLTAEVLREENLEEAEHAFGILGEAFLWVFYRI